MDSDYDRKFEDMKKYIPFLESMINRLESTSSSSNPRQAQLDKIRSLRDLLLDKKKRMKMENLLKCEQVLVNLYAKVEQRDTLPGIIGAKMPSEPLFISDASSDKQNLSVVRNKLKTVSKTLQEDTLPEIARASETEEVCTPGSKEPALFQRRPNKASISPVRKSKTRGSEASSPQKSMSKRNYTRVLVSPEPNSRRWTPSDDTPNKPLFSRRSPKKSPRRYSPSYHKKERKKFAKQSSKSSKPKSKDLNITLNVPEESLNSLNTEDILSRIINCHDGDVDIATLRDLRSQILGELKQTGAKDDISDLILKSYKKKKRTKQKEEVEEGELSDSESEAIESIYGSLVVVDKEKVSASQSKSSTENEKQARKIQICLVINSDKEGDGVKNTSLQLNDSSDFEMYDDKSIISDTIENTSKIKELKDNENKSTENQIKLKSSSSKTKDSQMKTEDVITINDVDQDDTANSEKTKDVNSKKIVSNNYIDLSSNSDTEINENKGPEAPEKTQFKANFYKPLNDQDSVETNTDKLENTDEEPKLTESQFRATSSPKATDKSSTEVPKSQEEAVSHDTYDKMKNNDVDKTLLPAEVDKTIKDKETDNIQIQDSRDTTEIPLLNLEPVVPAPSKEDVVSEIDILQALKNEILSESITIPGAEVATPALHQPKITKVSSAKEIMKKRISIEKYKEKSAPSPKASLFIRSGSREDLSKKQSLKLTEKECERFNFPAKLALDDSSEEEYDQSVIDGIYENLAPKSPENDETSVIDSTPPIIIPVDPVKGTTVNSKSDVDMRSFMPILPPNTATSITSSEIIKHDNNHEANKRPLIVDPRVRRELAKPINKESPNPHAMNPERTPRPMNYTPSVTPNMTPSMTPNARTYDMTPSHQPFDSDESSNKHVYAPVFPVYDGRDYREKSITRDHRSHWEAHSDAGEGRKSRWEQGNSKRWEDRDQRSMQRDIGPDYKQHSSRYSESIDKYSKGAKNDIYSDKRDSYNRLDHPQTPVHSFGRSDCPSTPTPSFGRLDGPLTTVHSFGRSDCPLTPSHPFGRSECPTTPSHPFGRNDCPTTPSHPFGRNDCPTTPSHPFGRNDCPTTPSHPFGRSDCPTTPSHPFGRTDRPQTPSHPFGRSECPMTPSHPFGRTECPMTPSHPFGRPEMNVAPMTPSHPFGRSDYHQKSNPGHKHVKDPRLNRANDYEFGSRHYNDDNDRDRRKSDRSERSYNSDSYRGYGREQSGSKNTRHNSFERGGRQNLDPRKSREPSVGRGMTREYEDERLYTRDRARTDYRRESDSRNFTEVGISRNYYRATSIGRTNPTEEKFYEDVDIVINKSRNDNKLSVKPQTGRSFTIDTSVNTTFQEFIEKKGMQVFDYSFDSRRKRAASVGRSFAREPSVGRTFREDTVGRNRRETSVGRTISIPSQQLNDTSGYKKMVNFVRARSMGRDIPSNKPEKSLKDIKADFVSYSASYNKLGSKKSEQPVKKMNYRDPRSRKVMHEEQQEKKSQPISNKCTYSPRKNNRDPRMRREQQYYDKNKYRYDENRKHSGIVYSNDNIAKGTILGTGYGVKNYKIPKIKRVEEKQETNEDTTITKVGENKEKERAEKDKIVEKSVKELSNKQGKNVMNKNKAVESKVKDPKLTSNVKEKNKSLSNDIKSKPNNNEAKQSDNANKRTTRSSVKGDVVAANLDNEVIRKPRKNVKSIIDSDSDDDVLKKGKQSDTEKTHGKNNIEDSCNEKSSSPTQGKTTDKIQDDELDISFGMDDMEIFTENISCDPVMANINALIADLDNDIDTSKSEDTGNHFTKEISLENMLQNIHNDNSTNSNTEGQAKSSLDDISEIINDELKKPDLDSNKGLIEKKEQSTSEFSDLNNIEECTKNNLKETSKEPKSQTNQKLMITTIEEVQKDSNQKLGDLKFNDSNASDIVPRTKQLDAKNLENENQENETAKSSLNLKLHIEASKSDEPMHLASGKDNEDIVSTTDMERDEIKNVENKTGVPLDDRCSTPDSTINTIENLATNSYNTEGMPDSTNEIHSDITSTNNQGEISNKESIDSNTSEKESEPQLNSIGNLLSILQDKTKIKELLSKLGDHSVENEKIKKKLERLSEIVSEDEETNDETSLQSKDLAPVSENSSIEKVDNEKEIIEKTNQHEGEQINQSDNKSNGTSHNELEKPDDSSTDLNKVNDMDNTEQETNLEHSKTASKARKGPFKKTRKGKWKAAKKNESDKVKRVTRSEAATLRTEKPNRELKQLQESIKEMFISDDILNATGIRMCRLAKLVEEKTTAQDIESSVLSNEIKPVVVLQKFKNKDMIGETSAPLKTRKKPGPKPKTKFTTDDNTNEHEHKIELTKPVPKYKPGPKSKTRPISGASKDPYSFDNDSVNDNTNVSDTSESENESLASSRSFGSSEVLADVKKKPKRKRRSGWKSGVIKTTKKKKKTEATARTQSPVESKSTESSESKLSKKEIESSVDIMIPQRPFTIPDLHCFTDKTYCFMKNVSNYACRLCTYSGSDIVHHYKKYHPHSEIPLSRMSPSVARRAIDQCEEINFQAISKIPSEKYICRFCFKVFNGKKAALETFFWHVVSTHTGEYKQLCSECINVTRCPFNLDIPPPPKDVKGQLIGYICGKCNFTQISLENLKIHVTVRHDDEQTPVYTINLALMSKKAIKELMMRCETATEQPRVLRSSLSNVSMNEASDERSDVTESTDQISDFDFMRSPPPKEVIAPAAERPPKRLSKLVFESDDKTNEESNKELEVKIEREDKEAENQENSASQSINDIGPATEIERSPERGKSNAHGATDDIVDSPHFKISYTQTGAKEYVCCINGVDNHYKTSLLISMKKHVQMKHSEVWDGYCFVCKVIVTTQGVHNFRECFQHLLDKHIDNFPVLAQAIESELGTTVGETPKDVDNIPEKNVETPIKPLINVRPLTDLLSKPDDRPASGESSAALPKIQSVVSLGAETDTTLPSHDYVSETGSFEDTSEVPFSSGQPPQFKKTKEYKYEEAQMEVMGKKHRVVLETMLTGQKLVKIFKCTGRFCSFTSDSADAALLHASTHQRIGGDNALNCAYCDFDCAGNAIDLVMHVFKDHGHCKYTCALCFYRAAASQLVRAHMKRAHPAECNQVVLETDIVTPVADESADMLTREQAVKHYVCSNDESYCKAKAFKTYTQGKFFDHLAKHKPPHICHFCRISLPFPKDVVEHMKLHDLKLYQCTWCVHGADNESEFLDHASTKHPTKKPQAYLRLITRKDGSTKMMVLPLAQLNKSKENIQLVASDKSTEDPVREAERSIDLEKLIGSVLMSQNEPETNESQVESRDDGLEFATDSTENVETPETLANELLTERLLSNPPRLVTPPPTTSIEAESFSQRLTPVLKLEPQDTTPVKETNPDVVYCLDSDEEDNNTSQNVINLSDEDDTSSAPKDHIKKIPDILLYKCSKCTSICRTLPAFKRHINMCSPDATNKKCAHCSFATDDKNALYNHYVHNHGTTTVKELRPRDNTNNVKEECYVCQVCNFKNASLPILKKHFKLVHATNSVTVQSDDAKTYKVLGAPVKTKPGVKRKLSTGTLESPPKRTRFGPQDLDQLPTKPILDELAYCSECEFSTKVRVNLVRHLQQHAEKQMVPQTVPVNPVPHLETNEKHFDKMVNLASSSIVNRAPDKQVKDSNPTVNLLIPPEAASQYPKYVPERQRHTCGAKDCSYISVDEEMLKRHWETLHAGSYEFHCVHCPPRQHLDTTKPLTASRIIAHLKMHDVRLYACSVCPFYHYKRQLVEKHSSEIHKGAGQVLIVREEAGTPQAVVTQPSAAPTMDLKPWQCGLCKFKSMLRPEVIEHCAKVHSTKMQFRCPNCPFRASTLENVSKHKSNSHPESTEDVIYYYYREGSISDEPDGTPRWCKQRQKMGITGPDVKTETNDNNTPVPPPVAPPPPAVDLNIVKKEVTDMDLPVVCTEMTTEDLLKKFGEYCDPNGLKYKCPLCKLVTENSKDDMQSHLFEELKYRRWSCSICSYKAFHKAGLNEHMFTEHRQRTIEPKELPLDINIELWVSNLLDHQTNIIEMNRQKLTIQKVQNPTPAISKPVQKPMHPTSLELDKPVDVHKLEEAFGDLGAPKNNNFCCPKCNYQANNELAIKDHLESELNKIRWNCSNCSTRSQNYHEAQLHCKTCKAPGTGSPRPIEAVRDPKVREAWVTAAISRQKLAMNEADSNPPENLNEDSNEGPSALENSLLVVRYEQRVPTPEEEMRMKRKRAATVPTTQLASPDSDDERLVIDEPSPETGEPKRRYEKNEPTKQCPHCGFTSKYNKAVRDHILRHYDLKPFICNYCLQTCQRFSMASHNEICHPGIPESFSKTKIPSGPPTILVLKKGRRVVPHEEDKPRDDSSKVICLVCEKSIPEAEKGSHSHDKFLSQFAKKGDVVVKCCICLALFLDVDQMQDHHKTCHPSANLNYAYFKLHHDTREIHYCGHCDKRFKFIRDLRTHHNTIHSSLQLKYEIRPFAYGAFDADGEIENCEDNSVSKNKSDMKLPSVKRVAKKSTTKLPRQTVAKKSTTKLPFYESASEGEDEYSFYGTKPSPPEELENVTALMPFCNTMMPFTYKKLCEIIKINPKVLVKDINK